MMNDASEPNKLRSIEEIPARYRCVFRDYPCFNVVQSTVLDEALKTYNSLVVSAPTGSGKTAIFEMAIIRELSASEETITNNKIIYICPIKALCQERLIDWHKKFSEFGLKCIAATGDTDEIDSRNISQYNLIIATPEKWDVISRRWRENQSFINAVKLFLIDEVHLLGVDNRGSTLEVIVSRMKTAMSTLILNGEANKIRFIALSATIPNIEDVAEWIGPSGTATQFKFSEESRPVKLNKIVLGYSFNSEMQSVFKFDMSLSYKIPNLVTKYSEGKPSLIFCNTRKSVEMTANHLVNNLQIRLSQDQKNSLIKISQQITNTKLKQYIVHGIAFHHAGLVLENRSRIEECFRNGSIPVLVTTSTLAMGVNLPAHLVIVKSTKCYSDGGYKDYDEVAIFQMIGRAGRSQFDTTATALILTSLQDKGKYENVLRCTQNIESNLHKHLTEHLNAEVVLKTITDLDVAMRWLSSTFLYVRARKSPEKYKLPAGLSKEKVDKKLLHMCQIDLNKLVRAGMVKMNQAIEVSPTVVGEIMAKYYVAFDTMKLFTQTSGNEILIQILAVISKCKEFCDVYVRNSDKKCLNMLNKSSNRESNRFPLSGRIKTVDQKVNCIIQAILGNLDIPDQSIQCDSIRIIRNCERLANCLIAYLETKDCCYNALLNTVILAKCFRVKLWENSPYVSKQLTGVGQVISTALMKAGKTSIQEIANTNPRHIEMIVSRKAPFGSILVEEATRLPRYTMNMSKQADSIDVVITLQNPREIQEKSTISLDSIMTLLVGDSNNNILLHEKYGHSFLLDNPEVKRSFKISNDNLEFVRANFISENFVGIDCTCQVELNYKVPVHSEFQKKNPKQTFIDMYMQHTKKAYTYKKKIEGKTTIKKAVPSQEEVNSGTEHNHKNEKNSFKEDKTKNIHQELDINKPLESHVNMKENVKLTQTKSNEAYTNNTFDINAIENSQIGSAKTSKTSKEKGIIAAKTIFRTQSKSKSVKKPLKKAKCQKALDKECFLTESEIKSIMTELKKDKEVMEGEGDMSYATFEKRYDSKDNNKDENSLAPKIHCDTEMHVNKEDIENSYTNNKQENVNTDRTQNKEDMNIVENVNKSNSQILKQNVESSYDPKSIFQEAASNLCIQKMKKKYSCEPDETLQKTMERPDSTVEQSRFSMTPDLFQSQFSRRRVSEVSVYMPPQKSIKWRSPLVHSPATRYSPRMQNFCFESRENNRDETRGSEDFRFGNEDSSASSLNTTNFDSVENESSVSLNKPIKKRSKNQFALSDQACLEEQSQSCKRKVPELEDICDLEYYGLSKSNKPASSSKSGLGQYYTQLVKKSRNKLDESVSKDEDKAVLPRAQNETLQNAEVQLNHKVGSNSEATITAALTPPSSLPYANNGNISFDNIPQSSNNAHQLLNESFNRMSAFSQPPTDFHFDPRSVPNFPEQRTSPYFPLHERQLPRYPTPVYPPLMCCGHHQSRNSYYDLYPQTMPHPNHFYNPMNNRCSHVIGSQCYGNRINDIPQNYIDHCLTDNRYMPESQYSHKTICDIRDQPIDNRSSSIMNDRVMYYPSNQYCRAETPQLHQQEFFNASQISNAYKNNENRDPNQSFKFNGGTAYEEATNNHSNPASQKSNIHNIFARTPKRLSHGPVNFNLPQTRQKRMGHPKRLHSNNTLPATMQSRNFNSFEERLNDIIEPRNHNFPLKADRETQYNPYNRNSYSFFGNNRSQ